MPKNTTDPPTTGLAPKGVKFYAIPICDACILLWPSMCDNPECTFIRCRMDEVGEYLDRLLVRPVVNGERLPGVYREIVGREGVECRARASATDPPQDCDWPFCGCDPKADAVIAALQESGKL